MPLGDERHRAAVVKTAVERALAEKTSGGGQGQASGTGGNTSQQPQRVSVLTKTTGERSASDGVGRVGAFEVQVRPTATRAKS